MRDLSKSREIVVSFSNAQLGVKLVNARIEGKNKDGCKYSVVLAEVQCNSDAAHVPVGHANTSWKMECPGCCCRCDFKNSRSCFQWF